MNRQKIIMLYCMLDNNNKLIDLLTFICFYKENEAIEKSFLISFMTAFYVAFYIPRYYYTFNESKFSIKLI